MPIAEFVHHHAQTPVQSSRRGHTAKLFWLKDMHLLDLFTDKKFSYFRNWETSMPPLLAEHRENILLYL